MAATREARKREMIANLDNDVYIKALVDEAYATIFTGSTTNTVAQKKVKRIFEAEGCHIGASAKHDTWADKNGSFESVDAFLSSDNSADSHHDRDAAVSRVGEVPRLSNVPASFCSLLGQIKGHAQLIRT